jgi:hypothetical protein
MTKLEELKAAADDACAVVVVAAEAVVAADTADAAIWDDAAWYAYEAASADYAVACDAWDAELNKIQEEYSND